MCLFPFPNTASKKAYDKGIIEFSCGHCPECLQKKSRMWALRSAMEAKTSGGVMVTLTYDTYKVIDGVLSKIHENPVNPNIPLSKRHCQLFIKRLRKKFGKCKYLLTAERGRSGRAHYHALLFGVQFIDIIKYKMSERGNWIYKSKTLTDLWGYGICTVDCININAKTARYCTKYCSKDNGVDDTFMLFSRNIGDEELLKRFNGKSYWIDGREYPIPREIWKKVIEKRYKLDGYSKYVGFEHIENVEKLIYNNLVRLQKNVDKRKEWLEKHLSLYGERKASFCFRMNKARLDSTFIKYKARFDYYDYKYKLCEYEIAKLNRTPFKCFQGKIFNKYSRRLKKSPKRYEEQKKKRDIYILVRDSDFQYQSYLSYWKSKNEISELTRKPVDMRILDLQDNKYRSYKAKAIKARHSFYNHKKFIPPRSKCGFFAGIRLKPYYYEKSFALLPCHYRANDTAKKSISDFNNVKRWYNKIRDTANLCAQEIKRVKKIIKYDINLIL